MFLPLETFLSKILKIFFAKSHKKVGAHVGERRSFKILRSAPGAPLIENSEGRSASWSAAPEKFAERKPERCSQIWRKPLPERALRNFTHV